MTKKKDAFVSERKQALLGLGIMNETPLETIERVFTAKNDEYGNSWCKRGELAFVASMARKVDRLSMCEAGTVGAFDTKLDLVAYLALYNVMRAKKAGNQAPVKELFAGLLDKADRFAIRYYGYFNSGLVSQIVRAYEIFYRAAVVEEAIVNPCGYWAGMCAYRSCDEPLTVPSDDFSLAALAKAWVLYCREHAYIKVLCE